MEVVLVVVGTLLVCFLADKGFTKLFRSKPQHQSGKSVRLGKHYGVAGLILVVLGLAAIFSGMSEGWLLAAGGGLLIAVGIGLIVYYMTFGIFYDDEGFVLTTFGRKSHTYAYREICGQQLYNSYGNIIIELHLSNGRTAQIQSGMPGAFDFLDFAFAAWCRQTGRVREECGFYDPANSCWFPSVEG